MTGSLRRFPPPPYLSARLSRVVRQFLGVSLAEPRPGWRPRRSSPRCPLCSSSPRSSPSPCKSSHESARLGPRRRRCLRDEISQIYGADSSELEDAWGAVGVLVTLLSATACFHGALQDGFGAGPWRGIPVSVITSILMWWCPQHLLLVGRVRWLLCCPEPC